MDGIISRSGELGVKEAVTTAKDAVKLDPSVWGKRGTHGLHIWVLEVEMEIVENKEAFFSLLCPNGGEV